MMDAGHRPDSGSHDAIELAHVANFALAGVEIRPSTREAVCRGAVHVVEPRVMQVLVALAQMDGGILSRDDLTRMCWDGRVVGEDAINRVISRLRRLSEDCGGPFRVETITRVGYRLVRGDGGEPASPSAPARSPPPGRRPWYFVVAGAVILALVLIAALLLRPHRHRSETVATPSGPGTESIPADPQTAAMYLQARQDWALRQSASITRAIGEFGDVIARDPAYAPAYAGLADSYILAREFGTLGDDEAFPKAKAAAQVGLHLDPSLVGALRAQGFVQYWWDHDPRGAGATFGRALALSPDDAQSQFWYANILADNGEFPAAFRHFDAARAINPESIPLQVDLAWAQWSAGQHDPPVTALNAIAAADPRLATPHDSLATIYLADRNYGNYLKELAALAALRRSPKLDARVKNERAAYTIGAPALAKRLLADSESGPVSLDRAWPAFVASAVGDHAALIARLTQASQRREQWGSAGEVAQIARNWATDPQVMALLPSLKAPAIEPAA